MNAVAAHRKIRTLRPISAIQGGYCADRWKLHLATDTRLSACPDLMPLVLAVSTVKVGHGEMDWVDPGNRLLDVVDA
jgi:hypothetical protein